MNVDDLEVGGVITVFPEGHVGVDDSQTMLIRAVEEGVVTTRPGRETWAPEGYVAYSKVCTHAGCPVGLYQQTSSGCSARATSRRSTCSTAPVPCSAPPPARSRSSRSWSTTTVSCARRDDYNEPVGPGFWNRDT